MVMGKGEGMERGVKGDLAPLLYTLEWIRVLFTEKLRGELVWERKLWPYLMGGVYVSLWQF